MRTTVTLPADLHEYIREIAHLERKTMSQVVVQLLRRGQSRVEGDGRAEIEVTPRGFPVVSVGRPVTSEDVRSLEDD